VVPTIINGNPKMCYTMSAGPFKKTGYGGGCEGSHYLHFTGGSGITNKSEKKWWWPLFVSTLEHFLISFQKDIFKYCQLKLIGALHLFHIITRTNDKFINVFVSVKAKIVICYWCYIILPVEKTPKPSALRPLTNIEKFRTYC